ncbi:hypothetical protein V6N11_037119 [Hibiscus sabdariffa]|uniref:Uncharacterized protein n=1 Tax=Hibiscus sabdariffa TaxID=183260 RepID=A0ABR2A2E5_9ROSI
MVDVGKVEVLNTCAVDLDSRQSTLDKEVLSTWFGHVVAWSPDIRVDDAMEKPTSFERSRFLIETEHQGWIDEVVELVEFGVVFLVVVEEAELVHVSIVESRGVGVRDQGALCAGMLTSSGLYRKDVVRVVVSAELVGIGKRDILDHERCGERWWYVTSDSCGSISETVPEFRTGLVRSSNKVSLSVLVLEKLHGSGGFRKVKSLNVIVDSLVNPAQQLVLNAGRHKKGHGRPTKVV